MLLRSKSATNISATQAQAPSSAPPINARTQRKAQFLDASDASKNSAVGELCQEHYGYGARTQQQDTVVDLLNGLPVFLLAGTGFGKSRVPELFYLAHDPDSKPIILCINPLDGLGNDQVRNTLDLKFVSETSADRVLQMCCVGVGERACRTEGNQFDRP